MSLNFHEREQSSASVEGITISNLKKNYGPVQALRGVDIKIELGEIFGVIGPDGVGKSSMFNIVGGVMEPSSGTVDILGRPVRQARSEIGYLTQAFSLYPDLSVRENLRYLGALRGFSKKTVDERGDRYLDLFNMAHVGDRLAGMLSGGMKQKLALACALIASPRLLLLDEPTTGVDPVSRREFWDVLANLSYEGMTILVATPYLDEAERCHRIALMNDGLVASVGTPEQLKASLGLLRLEVYAKDLAKAEAILESSPKLPDVQRFGDRLDVLTKEPELARREVEKLLKAAQIEWTQMIVDSPTLENVYVASIRAQGLELKNQPFPFIRQKTESKGVAIGAYNLDRHFGDFVAVDNVNIEIQYGEIYGLLGANGAGKTTTIKMLCGLLKPTSGEISLVGENTELRSQTVREQLGYMSQKFSLYNDLNIDANLEFFSGIYGVLKEERQLKIEWVKEFAGLTGKGKTLTSSLPGGWKQRVAFGSAIIHEPRVIFLDEPTSGVDPLARRAFWRVINALADHGNAILVTTHDLEEAEQCTRLGLMVAGRLVVEGAPSGIKNNQPGVLFDFIPTPALKALQFLKSKLDSWRVSLFGARVHVILDSESEFDILRDALEKAGITIQELRTPGYSLEDVFIKIVEKERLMGRIGSDD